MRRRRNLWSQAQDDYLRQACAKGMHMRACAHELERTYAAVRARASILGLEFRPQQSANQGETLAWGFGLHLQQAWMGRMTA